MRTRLKLFGVISVACMWLALIHTGVFEYPHFWKISYSFLTKRSAMVNEINWKTVDLIAKSIPQPSVEARDDVKLLTHRHTVKDIEVFYREALPPNQITSSGLNILLLHGRSFTSETWEKLETIKILAAMGHHVVAVDLPGYGNTIISFSGDKSEFLVSFLEAVNMKEQGLVIVSPSMSGEYSCAFLTNNSYLMAGYVPVAPVATNTLSHNILKKIEVPTLIVYGSDDNTGLAETSLKNLSVLPNSREIKIEGAGHAAYLNQPAVFHKLMYNFLQLLKQ